ncbi:SPW repeat protein [Noviherbaspirillum aridicola]|uniref:SPW repeat-containing integral membrane domain-containing protein n=1 Tax=Noviherbaspirillum aridicola TaxID=2849687 RepID=A0ABQ4QA51_9BURK|nr:SPW repeat protein [Noviherbaspirillum aridicola]GIZ53936.1 hypothetical protein NCCP691_39500 [Noviherbaspirillum aridicola]
MKTRYWHDWLNLLLGAWLFVSPWALNFTDELPRAATNAWIVGAAIALIAAAALYVPKAWEEILNFLLGAWAIASPWLLGFAGNATATNSTLATGILVAVLALWAAFRSGAVDHWRHGRHA